MLSNAPRSSRSHHARTLAFLLRRVGDDGAALLRSSVQEPASLTFHVPVLTRVDHLVA